MSEDTNQTAFVPVPNAAQTPPTGDAQTDPVTTDVTTPPPAPKTAKARTQRVQAVVTKTDPVTTVVTTTDVITETVLEALPASATLAAPYAFYDDDGERHSWAAGQVLVDPDEIAMLLDRGALFTPE